MTDQHTPLTDQQLDAYETAIADYRQHAPTGFACCSAHPAADAATVLLAEVRRLSERVAELEAYAHGCDAEGCVIPHSSWCDAAKKSAAENDGCTCPQPWKGSPQPHAGYCWRVSPPRDEVEQLRRALAANRARAWRDLADRADPKGEASWFGDFGPQVGAWMRKQAEYEDRAAAAAVSGAADSRPA